MKMPRKWLNEFVNLPLEEVGDKAFAEAMSVSGSKVEVTEDLTRTIHNVKVGRILSLEKHPNSDHMLVAQVDVGEDAPVQICTGAWNVHVGDLVPAALHKSLLPNGTKIEKGKLRGVESCGMLCSLKELAADVHDFPYGQIKAAALLNNYHPIDPLKPSISPLIKSGDRIFGKVVAAEVTAVENAGVNWFKCSLATGAETLTDCQNIHAGDLVAYNTEKDAICTLQKAPGPGRPCGGV